jgi:hypothetical protein
VLPGRALAAVILARSLLQVTVKRLFGEKYGAALFHENYDADRLPALAPDERERLASFSRCFACGRCDVGEAERIGASEGRYGGLMSLVLGSSRSMPDFDAAVTALDFVPDEVLLAKEAICPADVPFLELSRFVRAKATEGRAPVGELGARRRSLPVLNAREPAG